MQHQTNSETGAGPPRGPSAPLAAAACILAAARWIKAAGGQAEEAAELAEPLARAVSQALAGPEEGLVVVARGPHGLEVAAGTQDAPLAAWCAARTASGADLLGFNPLFVAADADTELRGGWAHA